MIVDIIAIVVAVGLVVVLAIVIFGSKKCPYCTGKLVDNDYDENIGKVVWTCEKCGAKWILY